MSLGLTVIEGPPKSGRRVLKIRGNLTDIRIGGPFGILNTIWFIVEICNGGLAAVFCLRKSNPMKDFIEGSKVESSELRRHIGSAMLEIGHYAAQIILLKSKCVSRSNMRSNKSAPAAAWMTVPFSTISETRSLSR